MKNRITFKQINQLAIPAILSGIAESIITLTDIAMVGNLKDNSVEALAAVGLVGSFLSGLLWILGQTKTSISSIVSQQYGANNLNSIKTLVPQALYLNIAIGLFLLGTTVLFAENIFNLYNASNLVLQNCIDYYSIRAFGFPLTLISLTLFGTFRGLQNTVWAMRCGIAAAVIHVGLNFILIYGVEGFIPAFGIKGAAYSSLIAQCIMVAMAFYYYINRTNFRFNPGKEIHPLIKPYISLSFNFILRTATLNVAFFVANAYATGYGANYIAAQSILMNIWLFFSFFIDGYSGAGNAMAGRLIGEKNYQQLLYLSKDIAKYSVIIALILVVISFVFYRPIGEIFNKDEEVLHVFTSVFWIVLLMQPINTLAYIFDGFFKGMGDAKLLRNNLIISTFLGFIPTLLITDYFGMKIHGIWLAFGIWMIMRSFPLMYIFNQRMKSKISIQ
ncbi:MATE family efflux transporter [Faecalibacter macacae]|uniref:Multidrug-efflux transporter n=1 Tax=Faecalibacter macacae TaxID=1859289 RepID=A0A3L9M4T7_9FLAO|nr:MATE family efflux transporter [Faecalibacter macacae]RLZ08015.1 MATE family efflux transporter [Faecalibacter macacae]